MRRVLHIRASCGHGGGPEKTLLYTPRFLEGSYDVRLAYVRPYRDPSFDMRERAKARGVFLLDIPEWGPLDPRTFVRLNREVRAFRPDIVHTHEYKTNALGLLLRKLHRSILITTVHGWVTPSARTRLYWKLDQTFFLRRFDRVICVSEDLLNDCRSFGVQADRCCLVENAIDTQKYVREYPAQEARRLLGLREGGVLIGAVGRLSPEKGFDLLIRAVAQLNNAGCDLQLVIAGDGPERDSLQTLIDKLQLGDRILLLGHRSDMIDVYQAMDVFALSSIREGLPNVLLEAMALETPVVATRVAGVPRLVQDKVSGLLIEPNSVPELVAGLDRMIQDAELRKSLARAARRTIEDNYGFAQRMEKIRAIYDDLLRDKKSSACGRRADGSMPTREAARGVSGFPGDRHGNCHE